mgnify:CR=1 FL=1
MPKTDPEIITLGAVGTATVTAPSTLDGATVQSIEGGTVTRAGSALAGGETLHAGETLTFTPATAGGTTYLNVRVDNAEFSGHYDDLDGKPDGTGATGPAGRGIATITVSGGHLTGTYSDGTPWDAGALPAGSGGGLDAEAVQDIVGAMLGEAQGHYDDAAGTYTMTFPQGRTDEEIQDVVAALIQAGANVTKTYDDAGNVLTISATGGDAGAVYLSTVGTPNYTSNERLTGPNIMRVYGPSMLAPSTADLTYTRMEVPLISAKVLAGDVVRLAVINVTTGVVVSSADFTLNAGQTSIVWNGNWKVPAGIRYAFVCGSITGSYSNLNDRFYGMTEAAQVHDYVTGQFTSDTVIPAPGATYSGSVSTTSGVGARLVLLTGVNNPKNVTGPLDSKDLPTVTTTAQLALNSGALLLNGNTAPRWVYKTADGSVWYGAFFASTP